MHEGATAETQEAVTVLEGERGSFSSGGSGGGGSGGGSGALVLKQ